MQYLAQTFEQLVNEYKNEGPINDQIHEKLTDATWKCALLSGHRKFIEENKLGFGDAAFHAMWAKILEAATRRHTKVRALEIGVFKGQIISLWALLAKTYRWPIEITGISPLEGSPPSKSAITHKVKMVLSRKYRERVKNADFYEEDNYEEIIRSVFDKTGVEFSSIRLLKGLSTDVEILKKTANNHFEIVYVDGDHTFNGALHDFEVFGAKVVKGGWLVADDAGCSLPGTKFWKGHEAVSKAVGVLPSLGFLNILNVGHNRVFEKIK